MNEKRNRNTVIFGGNGYVGTALMEQWLERDADMEFFSISRSGKGKLNCARVHYLKADVTRVREVEAVMPEECDYIVDCVGVYTKDEKVLDAYNIQPAKVMIQIADKRSIKALGYIGGVVGPKAFVKSKADAIQMIGNCGHKTAVVEPALIYGNGRNDKMAKMVPVMKFFGLFLPKMKPVEVSKIANNLIDKLTE